MNVPALRKYLSKEKNEKKECRDPPPAAWSHHIWKFEKAKL
jgi:hypothetical protein